MGEHTGLKFLVYLFNFLLLLCGLALIVGGTMVQIHYKDYLSSLNHTVFIAPILLILAGCVMVLIAIFGCFGACKLLPWTLVVVAILLAAVFALEIAGSITAYMERASVSEYIERFMNTSMASMASGNQSAESDRNRNLWNRVQTEFRCCGARSFNDWRAHNLEVPTSCCTDQQKPNCAHLTDEMLAQCNRPGDYEVCPVYVKGCLIKAEEYAKANISIVGGIGLGVAAFQVCGVILAACLARKLRKDSLDL